MSVAKAQFRVVSTIVKSGHAREPGYIFTAGTKGVHVRRWLAQGRIAIVAPCAPTEPPPTEARRARQPDRTARVLGLALLALLLALFARVSRVPVVGPVVITSELAHR